MDLFSNIRLKIGRAMLTKEMAKINRKVYYSNISLVKSIGIVWDSSKPEDFAILSGFYQKKIGKGSGMIELVQNYH